ncbi:BTAD domain-containing putative transcriptional regulator [Glycomyces sp. NPDC047010]|uniref:AfsR/SARP family transcriptional regulator n=1 Tax=Glycomyces sp. NPDC047010 TaxID=3155023 RepID=UPI0033DE3045
MEFRVLGPLELEHEGQAVALNGAIPRRALALLLLEAGRVVPMHRLVEALWDDEPPSTARRQVQNTMAALRRSMPEDDSIERIGNGYRLTTTYLDSEAFRFEVSQAKRAAADGRFGEAESLLRLALRRWRGPALAGIGGRLVASAARHLDQERLAAEGALIDALTALGRHGDAIADARRVLEAHPLDQPLAGKLMLALYRSGDAAAALRVYEDLRARIADELGVDPHRTLRDLHTAILREDQSLDPPAAESRAPATRPALLPAAPHGFTGRVSELAELDALQAEHGSTRIAVIAGTGGIGKTTLAVEWSRRASGSFPDGQLYANMRGFDPLGTPVDPYEAVRGFLVALGTAPEDLPPTPAAQVDRYRSLLADRRVLVVLDNATNAAQVRPLLPGGPANFTLVTSRNPLSSLVAAEGARPMRLGRLSPGEGMAILRSRIGTQRVDAEPAAAEHITALCAGLPLALAVAAARAAVNPGFPLADIAEALSGTGDRLDALADDDPLVDVRTVFSWSYTQLEPQAAQMFRLLGLHPGPDCSLPGAASLAGLPVQTVRNTLGDLTDTNLIEEHRPGRYVLHDLLRVYAAELVAAAEPQAVRTESSARMFDHLVHSAANAVQRVRPRPMRWEPEPVRTGAVEETFSDFDRALAWLTAEDEVIAAATALAVQTGFDAEAWRLSWSHVGFLAKRGDADATITSQRMALRAAQRLSDIPAAVFSHRVLAGKLAKRDGVPEARKHLQEALHLADASGDLPLRGQVGLNFALLHQDLREHEDAASQALDALAVFEMIGDETWQASALNSAGWNLAQVGRFSDALDHCRRALELFERIGRLDGQTVTLDSIGYALLHSGAHQEAVDAYRRSLKLAEAIRERPTEAESAEHLGDALLAVGDRGAAEDAWVHALEIYVELGSPAADRVRLKLG